jgi:hypothetical protein
MRTFILNNTEYTIEADGDTPPVWNINVFRDGIRVNDVPYVISQRECDMIQAATGRNPLDELARIAEADVVLGRNQLSQPVLENEPRALTALRAFKGHQDAVHRTGAALVCACLPSKNPVDQDDFDDLRFEFAKQAMESAITGDGELNIHRLKKEFESWQAAG